MKKIIAIVALVFCIHSLTKAQQVGTLKTPLVDVVSALVAKAPKLNLTDNEKIKMGAILKDFFNRYQSELNGNITAKREQELKAIYRKSLAGILTEEQLKSLFGS